MPLLGRAIVEPVGDEFGVAGEAEEEEFVAEEEVDALGAAEALVEEVAVGGGDDGVEDGVEHEDGAVAEGAAGPVGVEAAVLEVEGVEAVGVGACGRVLEPVELEAAVGESGALGDVEEVAARADQDAGVDAVLDEGRDGGRAKGAGRVTAEDERRRRDVGALFLDEVEAGLDGVGDFRDAVGDVAGDGRRGGLGVIGIDGDRGGLGSDGRGVNPENGPAAGAELFDDGLFVAVAAVAGEVDDEAAGGAGAGGLVEAHPGAAEVHDPGVGAVLVADGGVSACGLAVGFDAREEAHAGGDSLGLAGGGAVEADDAAAVDAAELGELGGEAAGHLDDPAVHERVVLDAHGEEVGGHVDDLGEAVGAAGGPVGGVGGAGGGGGEGAGLVGGGVPRAAAVGEDESADQERVKVE